MTSKAIIFRPLEKACTVGNEKSVLEVALKNGISIPHSCGAMGSCSTCRVLVEFSSGELPPRDEMEQEIADMRGFADNERLSCQLPPSAGLVVRVPEPFDPDAGST
ncbi:MAG: 2Fe-2S iron-sulfur cluster-binding protein [Bdellovibrionales bacterium]